MIHKITLKCKREIRKVSDIQVGTLLYRKPNGRKYNDERFPDIYVVTDVTDYSTFRCKSDSPKKDNIRMDYKYIQQNFTI